MHLFTPDSSRIVAGLIALLVVAEMIARTVVWWRRRR